MISKDDTNIPVLVIGRNRFLCAHVVYSLGLKGIYSVVLSYPRASHLKYSKYVREYITLPEKYDSYSLDEKVNVIKAHINQKFRAIIPVDIPSIEVINHISTSINSPIFPISNKQIYNVLNNKILFSSLLKDIKVPNPLTYVLNAGEDLSACKLSYPIIFKPAEGYGSEGVSVFYSPEKAKDYLDLLTSNNYPIIAQEFVQGDLIGLNILSKQGEILAWTIQSQGFPGSKYTLLSHSEILNHGINICRTLKYSGVANFDIIYNTVTKSVYFLECNPRFWASTMVSTWMGVNLPYLGVLVADDKFSPLDFEPIYGEIQHARKFPFSIFFKNILKVNFKKPVELNENSIRAYRGMLSDIFPHIMELFIKSPMAPPSTSLNSNQPKQRFQSELFCPEIGPGSSLY